MSLPDIAIREDHELEQTSSRASEELMRHRWHWTLDESNTKRVSFREYASAVGRAHSIISRDANAYVAVRAGANTSDARERANMGAETAAATEAVAQARGITMKHARASRPVEIRRVREISRQRAEDKGTLVEEEAPGVAEWLVKSEKQEERRHEERRHHPARYIELEGYIEKARRALEPALQVARDSELDPEAQELLATSITNLRSLLNLIDLAIAGTTDVDWDGELASLTKG